MPDELAFGDGAHTFCVSLQKNTPPGHTLSHGAAGAALAFGADVSTAVDFVVVAVRGALAIFAALAEAVLDAVTSADAVAVEVDAGSAGGAAFKDALATVSMAADTAGRAVSPRRHIR